MFLPHQAATARRDRPLTVSVKASVVPAGVSVRPAVPRLGGKNGRNRVPQPDNAESYG